eukprot:4576894-Pleurochrysis_carterae.AAC.2
MVLVLACTLRRVFSCARRGVGAGVGVLVLIHSLRARFAQARWLYAARFARVARLWYWCSHWRACALCVHASSASRVDARIT